MLEGEGWAASAGGDLEEVFHIGRLSQSVGENQGIWSLQWWGRGVGIGGDSRGAGSEGPPSTEGWRWGIRRESCCRDRVKEFQTTLSGRLAKFALIELNFLGMVP
jgi:hypothetical protein